MHGDGGGGFSGGHGGHGGHGGGFGGHHHHHSSNNGDLPPGGSPRGPSTGRFWITAIGLILVFGLIVLSGHLH